MIADVPTVERIFINLMDNALRYTPEGGEVCISLQRAEDSVVATVSDSGDGIAPADRQRIFERFVQSDTSQLQRGSSGSGLGLTFVKLAVEAHGGRIWVEESEWGGAAIRFSIPAAAQTD